MTTTAPADSLLPWTMRLQDGDRVIVRRTTGISKFVAVCTVTVTPAHLKVHTPRNGSYRFWRKNGREVGGQRWYSVQLCPYTEEAGREIREANARQALYEHLQAIPRSRLDVLTPAQCATLVAALDAAGL